VNSLSSFYSLNHLEESMSYIERTARKLMPILVEIKKRMIPEKKINNNSNETKSKSEVNDPNNDDIGSENGAENVNNDTQKK
jgi:hypothetical protein